MTQRIKRLHVDLDAAIKVGIYTIRKIFSEGASFEDVVGLRDELTGIPNEKAFYEKADSLNEGYCLIALDVDNFKQCNDRYGHGFGDQILRRIARILEKAMPGKVIAHRLHGDEFLLICKDLETAWEASRIVRRNARSGDRVTVSQGICRIQNPREPVDNLLKKADQALYESKRKGKDRITIYHEPRMITF